MTLSALGITPKTPLGARVTLGRQPPDNLGNGYPIAKDRLWIMGVKAESATVQGRSGDRSQRYLTPAPGFDAFNFDPFLVAEQWDSDRTRAKFDAAIANSPAIRAAIEKYGTYRDAMDAHRRPRRQIHGIIVHRAAITAERNGDGATWFRRAAQEGRSPGLTLIPHPKRAPSCICEDGITAKRWNGTAYTNEPCMGEKCPLFADGTGPGGRGQACQKHATITFQLRWPNAPEGRPLPAVLASLDTSGTYNHAADAFAGMFADVERQWHALCLPGQPDYYGLPFLLRLVHVTKPGANGQAGRAFWTVEAVLDFPTGMTLQEWAIEKVRMLAAGRELFVSPSVPLLAEPHGTRALYLDATDISIPAT